GRPRRRRPRPDRRTAPHLTQTSTANSRSDTSRMNTRALPIGLPPVHHETLGSYLNRLADANHVTITAMSHALGTTRRYRRFDDDPTNWTVRTLAALSALTGRSINSLTSALPALRPLRARPPENPT